MSALQSSLAAIGMVAPERSANVEKRAIVLHEEQRHLAAGLNETRTAYIALESLCQQLAERVAKAERCPECGGLGTQRMQSGVSVDRKPVFAAFICDECSGTGKDPRP